MNYAVGIDTGGTFTDVTVMDEEGCMVVGKSPTTPDYVAGIMSALTETSKELRLTLDDLLKNTAKFVYGTTMSTNLIIERRSDGRTGLIMTKGFGDTLYIRRAMRPNQYDSQEPFPLPFAFRAHTREVTERLNWAGQVLIPLDENEVRQVIRELASEKRLVKDRIEAIAVCLMHSYANPEHEKRIATLIRQECPDIFVSLSTDIAPEIREYERASTAVFNACIGKTATAHLTNLEEELKLKGLKASVLVMHSMGGLAGIEESCFRPIALLYSGPAAGVVGARYVGSLIDTPNIISVDMGGTSFDVGIIREGEIMTHVLGEVAGYPIMGERVEIHSIGAGGGSIAWISEGILKVGPNSAGAYPGPACYDQGGTEPTVTDADVVLCYIDPNNFLGGRVKLSYDKAYGSIKSIADRLGLDVPQTAGGIVQIVEHNMINAMRVLTVERGIDPRDFVLMGFGGGGPTHVPAMSKDMGVKGVIIPAGASVFSSLGLLASNLKHGFSCSYRCLIDNLELEKANSLLRNMYTKATELLRREGMTEQTISIKASVDMSYVGQLHELNVPISSLTITPEIVKEAKGSFGQKYEGLYGVKENLPIQVVTFRLEAIGNMPPAQLKRHKPSRREVSAARKGHRQAYFEEVGGFVSTPIYDGAKIESGNEVRGPAIVEYVNTTLVIRPDQRASWDEWLNVTITV